MYSDQRSTVSGLTVSCRRSYRSCCFTNGNMAGSRPFCPLRTLLLLVFLFRFCFEHCRCRCRCICICRCRCRHCPYWPSPRKRHCCGAGPDCRSANAPSIDNFNEFPALLMWPPCSIQPRKTPTPYSSHRAERVIWRSSSNSGIGANRRVK